MRLAPRPGGAPASSAWQGRATLVVAAMLGLVAMRAGMGSASRATPPHRPVLRVEGPSWAPGRPTAAPGREARFRIRNEGGRRLVLNEDGPGCDCEGRGRRTILVAPGEEVGVAVREGARPSIGPVESAATFTTNDPDRPRLRLVVRGIAGEVGATGRPRSVDGG